MPELEYPPNVWLSVDAVIPLVKYATKLKISTQYIKNYKTNKKCANRFFIVALRALKRSLLWRIRKSVNFGCTEAIIPSRNRTVYIE